MITVQHDNYIDMFRPQLAWIATKKGVDVECDIELKLCLHMLYKGAKYN